MKYILIAWLIFLSFAEASSIVITFDNLPIVDTVIMSGESRAQKYINALNENDVKTVFFAIGETLENMSPQTLDFLNQLDLKGHKLANHSYSHPFLSEISVESYLNDVLKCHAMVCQFPHYRLWFRYPFLDVGLDPLPGASMEKARECAQKLKSLGFRNGYVTIDSFDWFIDDLLVNAANSGKKIDLAKLQNYYITHLRKTIIRYLNAKTDQENSLFKTHVFLFHANDLNALCLPAVIEMLKEDGWTISAPEDAFNDENALADFTPFIEFKIDALVADTGPMYLHTAEKTTQEFNEMVLGEE